MSKNLLLVAALSAPLLSGFSMPQEQEIITIQPELEVEEAVLVIEEETTPTPNAAEINCLAKNVYFEARGEGRDGMRAVAHVTMNRVQSRGFRNTVCGVVYQPGQFTWTRNGYRVRPGIAWNTSQDIAEAVYLGEDQDLTRGATYFHNNSVRPSWASRLNRTITVRNHHFYRG